MTIGSTPIPSLVFFFLVSLLPVLFFAVTSYLKISIVLSIVKTALGGGQVPSAAATGLLALVLTLHIMQPVGREAFELGRTAFQSEKKASESERWLRALEAGKIPVERFLSQHAAKREKEYFRGSAPDSVFTLIPAFVLTELQKGFVAGLILTLPFLVIDLLVATILAALGMMMVSPTVISFPLKILLFVVTDGWFHLAQGLIESYTQNGLP